MEIGVEAEHAKATSEKLSMIISHSLTLIWVLANVVFQTPLLVEDSGELFLFARIDSVHDVNVQL